MPTTYAHYRFGCDVLAAMPTDLREIVEKHRQLFDFGVHGPDLLFYDKPFSSTRINAIGYASHERTGADFFAQAVKALKASTQKEAVCQAQCAKKDLPPEKTAGPNIGG